MDVLCTFKIKIQSQNLAHANDHIQIKINIPNPSQELPASSKALKDALKDIDVLCTFKIKIENHNLECRVSKDQ